MRKIHLLAISALALIGSAMPAHAATVAFNFGSASGSSWGSLGPSSPTAANAWDANARVFTAGNGANTVRVRATGWSIDSSGLIQDSFLGGFTNSGLGVTSGDDSRGANNLHTVDNQTRTDFILLQFDQKVKLDSAVFNAFQLSGTNYVDNDATIGYGNTNAAWNAQPNLNNQNISVLNSLIPIANRYGSAGNGSSTVRTINASGFIGNVWLISAAMAGHNGDGKFDSFKFNTLKVNTVLTVPEPESWAMMITGFGLIGGAMRRRRAGEKLANA